MATESAARTTPTLRRDAQNALYQRALKTLPGGTDSNVRAWGESTIYVDRGKRLWVAARGAGIFSFGQTAFFGLGAYAYTIAAINFGGSTWAVLVAVLAAGAFAALLGYFMFFGGVNDVFVGLTTLALTLVLQTFMAQTAGPEWRVGAARLNGFNGMSGMPPLTIPWFGGDISTSYPP